MVNLQIRGELLYEPKYHKQIIQVRPLGVKWFKQAIVKRKPIFSL